MSEFLSYYQKVAPTTWVYLSSLLMIGLYFKFGRFWSVRNLDLMLLILLAPGLLLVLFSDPTLAPELQADISAATGETEVRRVEPWVWQTGYALLFGSCGLILIRLLADSAMVRRPLLEPNLTMGGLAFIGCSLFIFLSANILASPSEVTSTPTAHAAGETVRDAEVREPAAESESTELTRFGPGSPLMRAIPPGMTKLTLICSQLSIIIGIALIGYRHFDNLVNGIGAATMYLMLPYSAVINNRPDHLIPASLLVWAVYFYRRPWLSGGLLGLASGAIYYPFFLLPLWCTYYWRKGLSRFATGYSVTVLAMVGILILTDTPFWVGVRQTFGLWRPRLLGLQGVWQSEGGWDPVFRLPLLAAYVMMCFSFAIWPPQKNLGTLISCSAALMVGTQFWHGDHGGLQIAWYLPLLLLTIFRPNLEDRVAVAVLGDGWKQRKGSSFAAVEKSP